MNGMVGKVLRYGPSSLPVQAKLGYWDAVYLGSHNEHVKQAVMG